MRGAIPLVAALVLAPGAAQALPSFARDTGMPCVACHTTAFGPSLTPEGEAFKLQAYSTGGESTSLPLNLTALASFTRTAAGQGAQAPRHFRDNDNIVVDEVAVIYAGRVVEKVGALAEVRYDGVMQEARLGNVDLRYADRGNPGGHGFMIWGLSLNNNPSVQDVWNTSPVWTFPFAVSRVAPRPAAAPLIEGTLEQEVLGLSGYTVLYDYLYLELGGYRNLHGTLGDAAGADGKARLDGAAPYWRVGGMLQGHRHAWRLGAFGMSARLFPDGQKEAGSDRYRDFTYDATYSYRGERNHVKLQLAYTQEAQELDASSALALSERSRDRLRSSRATGIVSLDRSITLVGSAFMIDGSADALRYPVSPVTGSVANDPDSGGAIVEVAWGTGGGEAAPFGINGRVGLQLTHYDRFNGRHRDYDGSGRDAADNDSVFVYLWLAI